jgi:hypothetical protein
MKTFTYLRYLLNVQSSLPRELRRRLVVAGSRVVVEVVIGADIHITFVRHGAAVSVAELADHLLIPSRLSRRDAFVMQIKPQIACGGG